MSDDKTSSNKQPVYKKWWFWVIIIVAIIGVAVAAGGSNNGPEKVGEGNTTESTGSQENKTFKVGDTIRNGDYEITVKSVERNYTSGNQFVTPADGKEFVRVSVEVKNIANDKKSYNLLDWQIEDADGALESVSLAGAGVDESSLGSGELTAGGKKTGTLVFEVPKGQKNLKLHYKAIMSLDQEVVIEL